MDHRLISEIEKALNWSTPGRLGGEFARGSLSDLDLCHRLLTPSRLLDLLMRRSMSPFYLRCLVDGEDSHPQNFIAMSSERRGRTVPMADMRRIGALLKSGCTLVVPELNTYDPTMEVACRALQWWSQELVQVNCYLTTGEAKGFKLHWDDHDVIVVQLAGAKSWEVRGLSRTAPMYRDGEPNLEPQDDIVWKGTMKTGDVMHIPRGYWHQATREDCGTGFSLHATFGISKRTGVDFVAWLADQSRRDELFRHDLVRGSSFEEGKHQLRLTDAAVKAVTAHRYSDFLTSRTQNRGPARHVDTHGIFGAPDKVVCMTEFRPSVEVGEETIRVAAGGREILFDTSTKPALELLLSGRPVGTAEVDQAAGFDVAAVVEALLTHEICAEVTPDLETGYLDLVN